VIDFITTPVTPAGNAGTETILLIALSIPAAFVLVT
jgi:hypothetical protein